MVFLRFSVLPEVQSIFSGMLDLSKIQVQLELPQMNLEELLGDLDLGACRKDFAVGRKPDRRVQNMRPRIRRQTIRACTTVRQYLERQKAQKSYEEISVTSRAAGCP